MQKKEDVVDEAEQRRRKIILEASRQSGLEDRREEYRAAGLAVPAGEMFASLSLMLLNGWTIIRDPNGANVLLAPAKEDAR